MSPNPDLLVIVPSRMRPQSLPRMIDAWVTTGAFANAALLFAVDADDPTADGYRDTFAAVDPGLPVLLTVAPTWQPMVPKLNRVAFQHAAGPPVGPFALGFAGDDHVPRTVGWARRYVEELRAMGTGIVYGDDLLRGAELPTQWAMTADIVRLLGRMVPSDVEHLYCDDAILQLGTLANCLRYLPDVVIEHMHGLFGKAPMDEGYLRVNHPEQYRRDLAAHQAWRATLLPVQAQQIRALALRRAHAR